MSTLIDTIRIFAALFVFLGHTNFNWFFGKSMIGPQNGQDYVIIFFVLSGFVIAWSVDKKTPITFSQYTFERLTRLWSVAVPALAVGFLLDWMGQQIHPATYGSIVSGNYQGTKILISSLFLHESWFFSIRPGSNAPFWSLSYEFFYYLIFGAFMLLPGIKNKILVGGLGILIAGPKIILLLPCWLLGVITYYACKKFRPNTLIASLLVVLIGVLFAKIMYYRWEHWHPWDIPGLGLAPLFYSAKFLDDYIIAILSATLIFGFSRWFTLSSPSKSLIQRTFRHLAGCSFSLYAFHFPIMVLLGALWSANHITFLGIKSGILVVLICCYLFSIIFERPLSKFRSLVRYFFPKLSSKCGIYS